jgi:hypothetical protein
MPTHFVTIDILSGAQDCECCGSYSWAEARVSMADGSSHEFNHDGHFGYGGWNGDEGYLRLFALGLAGFIPHIDGEPVDMPLVFGPHDASGEATVMPVHLAHHDSAQAIPIAIEWRATDPDGHGYRDPLWARWTMEGANHELEMGDKAGYDQLWIAVAESAIEFHINRERSYEDDDDYDD